MKEFIKEAANISTQHQLLAYAIAALILVVSLFVRRKLKRQLPSLLLGFIVFCIVLLAVAPTVGQIILAKMGQNDIYRITVTVVKSNGNQVADAHVTASVPFTPVVVGSSSQLEITPGHLPANRNVTITATDASGALTGSGEVTLSSDRNPSIQITVSRHGPTVLSGTVFSHNGNGLAGAKVWIDGGSSSEQATTDSLGRFLFETHFAEGEAITVIATNGRRTIRQQHIAGDGPVNIQF